MKIPVYVSNRDRLGCLKAGLEFLCSLPNADVTVLDNASTYRPLLDYYASGCPAKVLRLPENLGPRVAWSGAVRLPSAGYYVVTDGDLLYDGVPPDVLEVMARGLEAYSDVCKVGLSEDYFDIPAGPRRDSCEAWLGKFWTCRRDSFWWNGDIDCTFAMYRAGGPVCVYGPALRADRPYSCKQYGWYLDPKNLPADEAYYLAHIPDNFAGGTVWSPMLRDEARSVGGMA